MNGKRNIWMESFFILPNPKDDDDSSSNHHGSCTKEIREMGDCECWWLDDDG
tara:strand:- start:332 stop:487 length:156 start_codon:yes stop_codon:yes gene_type:complete